MAKFFVCITVFFFIGTEELVCAQPSIEAVPLPLRNYILSGTAESQDTTRALTKVRKHLISSFTRSGLAKAGYPKPCYIVTKPDPSEAGGSRLSCEILTGRSDEPDGILLTSENHFMQLSVIDFPDSRLYLAEVFIVPSVPDTRMSLLERFYVPRVALHFPFIPPSWHPIIWRVIQEGLESSGAKVIDFIDETDAQQGAQAEMAGPRR